MVSPTLTWSNSPGTPRKEDFRTDQNTCPPNVTAGLDTGDIEMNNSSAGIPCTPPAKTDLGVDISESTEKAPARTP